MPTTTIHGLRHYFRLEGDPAAPPLVLIHAIGTDHALWDAVTPALTATYQVLRYDLRGHGGTQTPQDACTVEALAQDLLALADGLGWQRFRLCGLSIGALVALEAALSVPSRVVSMALVSAAARVAPPPGGWEARARAAIENGMAPLAGPMVERMFSRAWHERTPPLLHTMKSVFLHTDPLGYAAGVRALEAAEFTSRLKDVACPTLVVRGEDDMLLPRAAAEALATGIPGGRLAEVPGGHFPPLEAPEEFVTHLLRLTASDS